MTKYIDVDKIVSSYRKQIEEDKGNDPTSLCAKSLLESVIKDIECFPKTDAEPVVHAHWIPYNCADPKWLRDDGKSVFMVCSHCEQAVARNFCGKANYCPYCGAKMEE